MIVKETEEFLKGWVHDFFATTWPNFVELALLLAAAVWVWLAAMPAVYSEHAIPRPLSWVRTQVEAIGWQYPQWLNSITDWQVPHGIWWPQVAVIGAAIMCTLAATTAGAPGYRLAATALLLLAMQWFGVGATLMAYVVTIVAIVLMALARCLISNRFETTDATYAYQPEIVFRRVFVGPIYILVAPVALPVAAVVCGIRAFAFDNALLEEPVETAAVKKAIDLASPEAGSAATMSARQVAILLTIAQLAGQCDRTGRARVASHLHSRYQQRVIGVGSPVRTLASRRTLDSLHV